MTRTEILEAMSAVKKMKAELIEKNQEFACTDRTEEALALIPKIEELNELFMDLYEKLDEAA